MADLGIPERKLPFSQEVEYTKPEENIEADFLLYRFLSEALQTPPQSVLTTALESSTIKNNYNEGGNVTAPLNLSDMVSLQQYITPEEVRADPMSSPAFNQQLGVGIISSIFTGNPFVALGGLLYTAHTGKTVIRGIQDMFELDLSAASAAEHMADVETAIALTNQQAQIEQAEIASQAIQMADTHPAGPVSNIVAQEAEEQAQADAQADLGNPFSGATGSGLGVAPDVSSGTSSTGSEAGTAAADADAGSADAMAGNIGDTGQFAMAVGGEVPEEMPMTSDDDETNTLLEQLGLGPMGLVDDIEGDKTTGVEDDLPMELEEGAFVLNADSVELAGIKDLNIMIKDAVKLAAQSDVDLPKEVDTTKKIPIKISNGEFVIPKALVPFIGIENLEKLNAKGLAYRKKKEAEEKGKEQEVAQADAQAEAPVPPVEIRDTSV